MVISGCDTEWDLTIGVNRREGGREGGRKEEEKVEPCN